MRRRPVRRRRRLLRVRAAVPQLRARLAVHRHDRWCCCSRCSPTCSTAASCSPRRCRRVRPATKGHVAVLLAVLAALKAADYWVSRYETTNERRGFVQGATYAVVHAQLPALMLLMLVALLTAGLYLSTLRTRVVAAAARRVGAVAGRCRRRRLRLPGGRPVAGRQPQPAVPRGAVHRAQRRGHAGGDGHQPTRSTARDVDVRPRSTRDRRRERPRSRCSNVRLLNPTEMLSRFQHRPGRRGRADDRRPRRRPLRPRRRRPAASRCSIAARELDVDGSPQPELAGPPPHQHPRVRAGDGAGGPGAGERPAGLPARRARPPGAVLQPEPRAATPSPAPTAERAGLRRRRADVHRHGRRADVVVRAPAAFALAFLDYNVLGSGAIDAGLADAVGAQRPRPRREAGAVPVLRRRPVPGRASTGAVLVGVDAYTSTSRYPYAERVGNDVQLTRGQRHRPRRQLRAQQRQGGRRRLRRLGALLRRRRRATRSCRRGSGVPDLFTPASEMPAELREHLRYPEDLFRVQTERVLEVPARRRSDFFERDGAWSVAQAPTRSTRRRVDGGGTARRRPRRRDRRHAADRAGHRVVERAASSPTTRCSRDGRRRRLRAAATVRAVLA